MCGIFGCFDKDLDIERGRRALDLLEHRGPDQWNEVVEGNLFLGHRRLSILDLSDAGRQPMVSDCGDYMVIANGEIYNYLELKHELEIKGYKFKSQSDTEVLLIGFMEWGMTDLLERIDGMYAFAIYDHKNKDVFLVRDRYGIKPIYYSIIDGNICWASELKSIVYYYDGKLTVDKTALFDFLTYLYVPSPKTAYKNVFKLRPANYLKFNLNSGEYDIIKYWSIPLEEGTRNDEDQIKDIFNNLSEEVKKQLVADVPVGFFSSGGLDSSIIISLAKKYREDLNTYNVSFNSENSDESYYANLFSRYIGANLETIEYSDRIEEDFSKLRNWFDEPYADTSCFPTFLVSSLASKKSTVVLTGDGADEMFGGYKWYSLFKRLNSYPKISANIFNIIWRMAGGIKALEPLLVKLEHRFVLKDLELYSVLLGGMSYRSKIKFRKLFNIPEDYDDLWYFREYYRKDLSLYKRLRYLDFHTYMHDDVLTKVDRASMQHSIECRVPFLNKKLVQIAFSLTDEQCVSGSEFKLILKKTFQDILPREILFRQKKGFSIPNSTWLKDSKTVGRQGKVLNEFDDFY